MLLEPYIKSKVSAVSDITYRKPLRNFGYVTKRNTYIIFPAIALANTWRGASEIIAKINFSLGFKQSFLSSFSTPPPNTNYCACISWKPTSSTIRRYKLWKNVGEILYVEDYSGQTINKDFSIELWNTPDTTIHSDAFQINTSQLVVPTDFCDSSDIEITSGVRNCTDLLFDLTSFVPVDGDYYITVADCGETDLIKPPKLTTPAVTLQSTDGTWHIYTLQSFTDGDGNTFITDNVDQTNASPSGLGYVPLINGSSVYPLALYAENDPVFGLTHRPFIKPTIGGVLDLVAYSAIIMPVGIDSYKVNLLNYNGNLSLNKGQTPYVP